MEDIIKRSKTQKQVEQMSPLTWAYIGDAVYELFIRNYLLEETNCKPHKLHIKAIEYVKASAQCKIIKDIEKILTDKEKDIVKRGRNTKNYHVAKNASTKEYMYSTAFEALIGYLYLTKQDERLKIILNYIIEYGNN